MIFDGSQLNLQDSVYDVAHGSGVVIELIEKAQTFRVDFSGRKFTYNLQGMSTFKRKTLFWRDPIGGAIPLKDEAAWDKYVKARNVLLEVLR